MRIMLFFILIFCSVICLAAPVNTDVYLVKSQKFKKDTLENTLKKNNKQYIYLPYVDMYVVESGNDKQFIKQLDKRDLTKYVSSNKVVTVDYIPSDIQWTNQWSIENMNLTNAWNITLGNSNVVVAVFDTGIFYEHPDLTNNLYTDANGNHGWSCNSSLLYPDGSETLYGHGHGTHVAGTIAAAANEIGVIGVSPHCKLLSMKFLGPDGDGLISDAIILANKLIELKLSGVNIVVANHSWGGMFDDQSLQDAFLAMEDNGILNVCAAGNSNAHEDWTHFSPAAFPNRGLISVQAYSPDKTIAYFSNYGIETTDIAAAGVNVLSTMSTLPTTKYYSTNGYGVMNGTSMAAPHVSGLAALVYCVNTNLSIYEIKDIILNCNSYDSIVDIPKAYLSTTGGKINAYKTLTNPLVHNPKTNTPPVWSYVEYYCTSPMMTNVVISALATDADGDNLRYSLMNLSDYPSSIIPFNSLTYTLKPFAFSTTRSFSFGVTDNNGGGLSTNFYLTFPPSPTNLLHQFEPVLVIITNNPTNYTAYLDFPINSNTNKDIQWRLEIEDENGGFSYNFQWFDANPADMNNPWLAWEKYKSFIVDTNSICKLTGYAKNDEGTIKATPPVYINPTGKEDTLPKLNVIVDKVEGQVPFVINFSLSNLNNLDNTNQFYTIEVSVGNCLNCLNVVSPACSNFNTQLLVENAGVSLVFVRLFDLRGTNVSSHTVVDTKIFYISGYTSAFPRVVFPQSTNITIFGMSLSKTNTTGKNAYMYSVLDYNNVIGVWSSNYCWQVDMSYYAPTGIYQVMWAWGIADVFYPLNPKFTNSIWGSNNISFPTIPSESGFFRLIKF